MGRKAIRASYYLIWICTREARHNKSLSADLPKVGKLFGPVMQKWMSAAGGEDGISKRFLNTPPDMPIGTYCKAIAWMFHNSQWSGGYGGKKWGIVTDCLVRFVDGEYSAEMMLDTVWTLAHNGGPIFNKGQFYACYNSSSLYRILDVQRSGQVPEGILYDHVIQEYAPAPLKTLMMDVRKRFGDKLGEYVDWVKVEALGAVHKYPKEKAAQIKAKPLTPAQKAAQEAAQKAAIAKAEAEAKAAAQEKLDHELNWFKVMPGVEVKKIKMVRAA